MLKRILLSLAAAVLAVSSFANLPVLPHIRSPRDSFERKMMDATFVLYAHKGLQSRPVCTAEAYAPRPDGYELLTAGHCIKDVNADSYSVREQVGAALDMPVTVYKAIENSQFDFAVLDLKTTRQYPTMDLGTIDGEAIGDSVINPNFAMAMVKQLSRGSISSDIIPESGQGEPSVFLCQLFSWNGASGSAVVDVRTHKVIGVLIYRFIDNHGVPQPANIGAGIEPIDRFYAFMNAPVPPPVDPDDPED